MLVASIYSLQLQLQQQRCILQITSLLKLSYLLPLPLQLQNPKHHQSATLVISDTIGTGEHAIRVDFFLDRLQFLQQSGAKDSLLEREA